MGQSTVKRAKQDDDETEGIPDHLQLLKDIKAKIGQKYSKEYTVFLAKISHENLIKLPRDMTLSSA